MYNSARRFWSDVGGQDTVEYALIAGLIAVVVAGFLPPTVAPAVSTIFSKVLSSFAAQS
jgi:Flp pilus assembly pilin Flp